jgi:hypothetical protein
MTDRATTGDEPPPRTNVYEVRPAAEGTGYDLVSDALAKGRMPFTKQHIAIGYATLHSGRLASVIRVYSADGQLIATHTQRAAKDRGQPPAS